MKLTIVSSFFVFAGILIGELATAQTQDTTFVGEVHRVWEDGFQLKTEDRSITVDSYDVCGDNTTRHITVGEQVTVTGEFEGGEFDAFSITKGDVEKACS
ncbi:hypothetical protein [Adonisia turfae]|uniref:DUF5666 domain-containing protein n=1 Tax=Adonisia turfae CCMR0081 TaxID=2292702 RepID=A0A6M0RT35_9CYAN|nr:hypothetical protein [Adonisia turfae]NEZ58871.1 hypothetical protein [Adonisia turfae CCMR0081]